VPDEQVRLIADVDWRAGMRSTGAAERDFTTATDRMAASTRKVDQAAVAMGASWQGAGRIGQRAMQAMAAGIGATTAAAAAGERQWLSLGTVILGSFAAGGPIAGGVALIGAAIGIMSGQATKAEMAFSQSMKSAREEVKDLKAELDRLETADVSKQIDVSAQTITDMERVNELYSRRNHQLHAIENALRKVAILSEKLESARDGVGPFYDFFAGKRDDTVAKLEEQAKSLREQIQLLDDLRGRYDELAKRDRNEAMWKREDALTGMSNQNDLLRLGLSGGFNRANEMALRQEIEAAELRLARYLRDLSEEDLEAQREAIRLLRERLGITEDLNDLQVNRLNNGVEREIELLRARNDVERERIRLRHRMEDMLDQGASPGVVGDLERATMAAIAARPWQDLLRSAEQVLGQGLSDLIYDGITNGFRNASDIAEQIWQSMLRTMINHFVTSGIEGLLSGIGGGGGGRGGGLFGIFGGLLGGLFGGGGGGGFSGYSSTGGGGVFTGGGVDLIPSPSIGGDPAWEFPGMAEGGLATRPTLRVVGERGPEAVIPLHRAAQMGGGGGVHVGLTVNVGSGGDPDAMKGMILAAVARAMDEDGAFRSAIKRNARRGL
jgi:hypothetical protein